MKKVYIVEYNIVDNMNRIRKNSIVGVFDEPSSFTLTMKRAIMKKHPAHQVTFSIKENLHIFA